MTAHGGIIFGLCIMVFGIGLMIYSDDKLLSAFGVFLWIAGAFVMSVSGPQSFRSNAP
jgi:hypothetical protein